MVTFETIFRIVLAKPLGDESHLAFILSGYPHQRRADTRGLRLEITQQRAIAAVATELLVVKTEITNGQRAC